MICPGSFTSVHTVHLCHTSCHIYLMSLKINVIQFVSLFLLTTQMRILFTLLLLSNIFNILYISIRHCHISICYAVRLFLIE